MNVYRLEDKTAIRVRAKRDLKERLKKKPEGLTEKSNGLIKRYQKI
jgi:hypothetical protein